jgi:hypothetical protein
VGGRSHNRVHGSRHGRRQTRLHLRRLRHRLARRRRGDRRRRLRGNDRGRRRDRRSGPLAGRGQPDRRRLGAGQEQQRVEVPVRIAAPPHAEVDVGHRQLDLAARADGPDEPALRYRRPAPDGDGAEMHERDRVAVLRLDRDGPARRRDGSGEGDDSGCRREHRCPRRGADVDPTVLAGRVRVVAEQERPQHGALHRPRPAQSGGGHGKRGRDRSADEQTDRHWNLPVVRYANAPQR